MAALVDVTGLAKHFPVRRSLGDVLAGRRPAVHAVDGIDLALDDERQRRAARRVRLRQDHHRAAAAQARDADRRPHHHRRLRSRDRCRARELKAFRRKAQLVFQNPFDALNPRFTIRRVLSEPLINAGIDREEYHDRIHAVLTRVHMRGVGDLLEKFPHQLSGGQLQRIVLARALILGPKFIVADEPVSMLDVSVRAGILNLMREIQQSLGLTAVYISHDLALVRYVARRTLVMYLATIVEDGPTERVVSAPLHPYTRALVAAVPIPRVDQDRGAAADPRQRAGRAQSAVRLPLPRPLPARGRALQRGGAGVARGRAGAPRGVSSGVAACSVTPLPSGERWDGVCGPRCVNYCSAWKPNSLTMSR